VARERPEDQLRRVALAGPLDADEGVASQEVWRIPILTDVLLAHIARAAGLADVQIWSARELRPRNVQSGAARESLVVARKPKS
jgi:hypothetical protein